MDTLYGESPEIQIESSYTRNGGIAVFSANNGDTQTGGSIYNPDGSYFEGYQVLWTITRTDNGDGTYSYTGGVTGQKWFTDEVESPFYQADIADIGKEAFEAGNLNTYFSEWLTRTNSDQKWTFLFAMAGQNCTRF